MKNVRIYDGSLWCELGKECPVVDHLPETKRIVIYDPHKPENGKFTMTTEEYNALIAHANPIA